MCNVVKRLIFCLIICFVSGFTLISCSTFKKSDNTLTLNPATVSFNIYRNYITPVDGNRCRMYPSCSEYCKQAVKKHGMIKGWIMTNDRLLRCGRNETVVSPKIEKNGLLYCNDSVENNDFWWYTHDSKHE